MKYNFNFIYNNWLSITITISIVIILFSFLPLNASSTMQGTDKYLHTVAYFFLSFPAALRKPTKHIFIISYFFSFGLAIELIQPYFDRYFELFDLIANFIGILLAITFADLVRKYYSN